ncbi:hypothetical protein [Streptomyces sp. NBC_00239]|uniref:hypothetical protein n=1 Tax=Streptomyces sp. NBC_00239 TaxID=2903640 RepID=UPI002E2DE70C|nr:hypothetical protein [Streptomyces sp. NBC_00239]
MVVNPGFRVVSLLMTSSQERLRYAAGPTEYLMAEHLSEAEALAFQRTVSAEQMANAARTTVRKRFSRAQAVHPTLCQIVDALGDRSEEAKLAIPFGLTDSDRFRRELLGVSAGLGDTCGNCLGEAMRFDEDRTRLIAMAQLARAIDGTAYRRTTALAPTIVPGGPEDRTAPDITGVHRLANSALLCSYRSHLPSILAGLHRETGDGAPSAAFACHPEPSHLLLVRTGRSDVSSMRLGPDAHEIIGLLQEGLPGRAVVDRYGAAAAKLIADLTYLNILLPAGN